MQEGDAALQQRWRQTGTDLGGEGLMEHVCGLLTQCNPEALVELVRDAVHARRLAARQVAERGF